MAPRRCTYWSYMILVILWYFLQHHTEVGSPFWMKCSGIEGMQAFYDGYTEFELQSFCTTFCYVMAKTCCFNLLFSTMIHLWEVSTSPHYLRAICASVEWWMVGTFVLGDEWKNKVFIFLPLVIPPHQAFHMLVLFLSPLLTCMLSSCCVKVIRWEPPPHCPPLRCDWSLIWLFTWLTALPSVVTLTLRSHVGTEKYGQCLQTDGLLLLQLLSLESLASVAQSCQLYDITLDRC